MRLSSTICFSLLLAIALKTPAADAPAKAFIDLANPAALQQITPTSKQVTVAGEHGVAITIAPGKEGYPGIAMKPADSKTWDLSAFGDVRASIVNTGKVAANISLRIDNDGPWQNSPWDAESVYLKPGETGEIKVIFGFGYGHKPSYALKPSAIVRLNIFATKSAQEQSFRIESITAAGQAGEKPQVDPESLRIEPAGGYIIGNDIAPESLVQTQTVGGVKTETGAMTKEHNFEFPASGKSLSTAEIHPKTGRWDLRAATEVRIIVKNTCAVPITPSARLESNGGPTDTIAAAASIAPGTEAEMIVPFAPAVVWQGVPNSGNRTSWDGQKNTGTKFTSDAVRGVSVILPPASEAQSLVVKSVKADAPPAVLPDWLGQRPPVAGEWVKTFDDEFDGKAIDETKWNTVGKNWYDHSSRFVKENTTVSDGQAHLRFDKKPGVWANPADGKETQYATGFLDTFGKWTQRYGYFEARMKLPHGPGLWPAFWMMPERGEKSGNIRGSTGDGGMEFDIMEHLTRWGPNRYNIAMHWDGYGKEHKQTGTTTIYVQPDKDGYITAGLLWTPGSAIYYCNGKEVLRWEDPRISSVPSDLMFTFPMGGWDNNALDDAKLPDDFVIDYVRCWQRKDLQADEKATTPAKEK